MTCKVSLKREWIVDHFKRQHGFRAVQIKTHFPNGLTKEQWYGGGGATPQAPLCFVCGKDFKSAYARKCHLRDVHDILMPNRESLRASCMACKQWFFTLQAAIEHSENEHPEVLNVLAVPRMTEVYLNKKFIRPGGPMINE